LSKGWIGRLGLYGQKAQTLQLRRGRNVVGARGDANHEARNQNESGSLHGVLA
jgi:hypothetical protein